jgi:rubrerythrin
MATANYPVAKIIAALIEDEWEAIEGYIGILEAGGLDASDVAQVEEIISDEKQHAAVLAEIARKYDGDIPVAED